MRNCPFHGCNAEIADDLFACRRHWFSLPAAQQQRIHWAYREYKAGTLSIEDMRAIQQDVLGKRGLARKLRLPQ